MAKGKGQISVMKVKGHGHWKISKVNLAIMEIKTPFLSSTGIFETSMSMGNIYGIDIYNLPSTHVIYLFINVISYF